MGDHRLRDDVVLIGGVVAATQSQHGTPARVALILSGLDFLGWWRVPCEGGHFNQVVW
jgi:hypothetical protein